MEDTEEKRIKALKKVDKDYYDRTSPHYKDNEHYSWAVTVINKDINKKKDESNKI